MRRGGRKPSIHCGHPCSLVRLRLLPQNTHVLAMCEGARYEHFGFRRCCLLVGCGKTVFKARSNASSSSAPIFRVVSTKNHADLSVMPNVRWSWLERMPFLLAAIRKMACSHRRSGIRDDSKMVPIFTVKGFVFSLLRAFDDDHAAARGFLPQLDERRVFRRAVPLQGLFQRRKFKHCQ